MNAGRWGSNALTVAQDAVETRDVEPNTRPEPKLQTNKMPIRTSTGMRDAMGGREGLPTGRGRECGASSEMRGKKVEVDARSDRMRLPVQREDRGCLQDLARALEPGT